VADKILNTGLDALLGDVTKVDQQTIKELDLHQIKPNRFQPRQYFDEDKINELSLSISKHGVLSPILVRETGAGGYELIAGERRLRAAKKAGLKTLPCLIDSAESLSISKHGVLSPILVRETGAGGYELIAGERRLRAAKKAGLKTLPCLIDSAEDQTSLELALIENLQREDLNPIEEARGYDRLKREFNLTQDNISEVTGKARSSVANSIRLLKLPQSIIDLLYSGDLEKGHAKILASMETKDAEDLAQKIVSLGMTVKDAAATKKPKTSNSPKTKIKNRDLLNMEEELSETLGHKSEIDEQSQSKGKISISYTSKDERETIISKLLQLKKN